jgi:hypothetical protein
MNRADRSFSLSAKQHASISVLVVRVLYKHKARVKIVEESYSSESKTFELILKFHDGRLFVLIIALRSTT